MGRVTGYEVTVKLTNRDKVIVNWANCETVSKEDCGVALRKGSYELFIPYGSMLSMETKYYSGDDMIEIIKMNAEQIKQIIEDTEYVQQSNESDYTKERSKISAYEEIVRLIKGYEDD